MIPIKAVSLIPEVAKKLNLPEAEVKKVIDFYYKYLKEKMTTLEFPSFVVENFGKFHIREKNLLKVEKNLIKKLENNLQDDLTPKVESTIRTTKEDISRIETTKKHLAEGKQKREFVKLYKKTYRDEQIKKDLERQITDSQRPIQPGLQAYKEGDSSQGTTEAL